MAEDTREMQEIVVGASKFSVPKNALSLVYVPLKDIILWDKNPKEHDLGVLAESIKLSGFRDPPGWDTSLNDYQGGVVEGNGRIQALGWMKTADPKHPPVGILLGKGGEWLIPMIVGVNAATEAQAEAYGLDHNNITMMGGPFTPIDIGHMYNFPAYVAVLGNCISEGGRTASVKAEDLNSLFKALEKEEKGEEQGRDDNASIIKIILRDPSKRQLIIEQVQAIIDRNNWKAEVH